MNLPEKIQVARIAVPSTATSRSDQFPVGLGNGEIGVALAIGISARLSTNSAVFSFMLSLKEVAAASIATMKKGSEYLLWDMYLGTAEATSVGVIKRTENQYFHFPYPVPFLRGPWLLTYAESGTLALAIATLYYLKVKEDQAKIAEMMVKDHG